jgi:hypothetical protein
MKKIRPLQKNLYSLLLPGIDILSKLYMGTAMDEGTNPKCRLYWSILFAVVRSERR